MRSRDTRRLEDAELRELEALARDHLRRAAVAVAAVLGAPLLFVLAAALGESPPVLGACAMTLVGVPAALLFGGESIVSARLLRRALRDPRVERFEGRIEPTLVRDPTVAGWLRAGQIDPERASIEVLAATGVPWSIRGSRVVALRPLRIVTIGNADREAHGDTRDLSASERAELARHAREASRIGVVPVYLIAIATAWTAIVLHDGTSGAVGWRPVVAIVLGASAVLLAIARRRGSARLRRDAARGSVSIVHEGPARIEVLPEDGSVWTIDGQPSPARTH